jgi:kumamolisin
MKPATPSVVLNGSERQAPRGAARTGPANAQEQISVSVYVRARNPVAMTLRAQQAGERARLTRQEYTELHGANSADVALVESFARDHGLQVADVDPARRLVMLTGTVAAMSQAFEVQLDQYEYPGGTFRGRTGAIKVPADIAAVVDSIHGLDNRPQAEPRVRLRPQNTPAPAASYTPPQVAELYNFPDEGDGSGQCIGLIELGGGYVQSDLDTYFGQLGLPTPRVVPIGVDGGSNSPGGGDADVEVALDIEVAGGVAPGATIAVYFTGNNDQNFIDVVTAAIFDSVNRPSVISISWGKAENEWSSQSLQTMDNAFQSAAVLGVTVCVATGDDGSSDGESGANVDFPSSSPHALACGGTTLLSAQGKITSETAWGNGADGATGGGVSTFFGLPSWQVNANVPQSANSGGGVGRGTPDVAADADPNTGYMIFLEGIEGQVGGTSAAAPLWAGLIALINQQLVEPVGYINPCLYLDWINVADVTQDIVIGSNGAYSAGPGWDACTGLGSPNGGDIMAALIY